MILSKGSRSRTTRYIFLYNIYIRNVYIFETAKFGAYLITQDLKDEKSISLSFQITGSSAQETGTRNHHQSIPRPRFGRKLGWFVPVTCARLSPIWQKKGTFLKNKINSLQYTFSTPGVLTSVHPNQKWNLKKAKLFRSIFFWACKCGDNGTYRSGLGYLKRRSPSKDQPVPCSTPISVPRQITSDTLSDTLVSVWNYTTRVLTG